MSTATYAAYAARARRADELYDELIRALLAGTSLARLVELRARFAAAAAASTAALVAWMQEDLRP
jgi:hypothetical protein